MTNNSGLIVSDAIQYDFYNERLPADVFDLPSLRRWLGRANPADAERSPVELGLPARGLLGRHKRRRPRDRAGGREREPVVAGDGRAWSIHWRPRWRRLVG